MVESIKNDKSFCQIFHSLSVSLVQFEAIMLIPYKNGMIAVWEFD
jgi:hypothetical protein